MDAKMTEVISKHSRRLKSYGPNAMNQYILGLDSMRLIVAAAESCAGLEAKCKGLDATNYLHTAEPEECSRCGDTLYTREGEWFGPEDDPAFVCFKCQRAELEAKREVADLEQRLDKMTRERDVLKKALSDKLKKTLRNLVDFYLEQNVDKQLRPGQFAEAARAATDAAKEGESDGLA